MGKIVRRTARPEDIDGIMHVEEQAFGPIEEGGMAAAREIMLARMKKCNATKPGYFFVTEEDTVITGYLILQPTNITPEECTSWAAATDNGTMEKTYEAKGKNLYVVSMGVLPTPHSAGTSNHLIYRMMSLWCDHGGLLMFCSRMPGFIHEHKKTGISAEEYWQLRRADGGPQDWQIYFYWIRSGKVAPIRLLVNGFPADEESGGHAVLFALDNPMLGQEAILSHIYRAALVDGKKTAQKRKVLTNTGDEDPRIRLLDGGSRPWWDITENRFVKMHTLYIPQRCSWRKCSFCSIPQAVTEYEQMFYGGQRISDAEIVSLFSKTLDHMIVTQSNIHTLCLFNAGSFFSDASNPPSVRKQLISVACQTPNLSRIIIETRASDVTEKKMHAVCSELGRNNIDLTVRGGVETQHEILRQYLKKGQSDKAFRNAVRIIHKFGALMGGYVLLHPAPFSTIRALLGSPEETEENILLWAEEEALRTLDFVLGKPPYNLGMDEAYFCTTNVGPNTVLASAWEKDDFYPAPLRSVCRVLRRGISLYGTRIHMLPFKDERTFLAIPSNHVRKGIAQNLSDAAGCDREVHAMLDTYRDTMNPNYLKDIPCDCNTRKLSCECSK